MVSLGVDALATAAGPWAPPPPVDATPKRLGFLRRVRPFLMAVVRLVWVLRPLVAPVAAGPVLVLVASVVGVRLGPAPVVLGPPLGLLAVTAGLLASARYRARCRRAFRQSQEVAFRLFWPTLCSLCGLITPGARRTRVPRLVSVEFGPGVFRPQWIRLEVVPLAQHDRSTWDRYEDRIGRELRYRFSSWIPSEITGGMEITVLREPLPKHVEVGRDVPVDRLGRRVEASTGSPRDLVLLGVAARGGGVVWRPGESGRSMLFIAGRTGGGKGVGSSNVLAHAVTAGWEIFVANPKRSGEFRWLTPVASIAKTPNGIFSMIAAVRAEMDRRADLLDEVFGVAAWDQVPVEELARHRMDRRVLLFIDELVRVTTMKGLATPPPPPADLPKNQRWQPVDPYVRAMGDLQLIMSNGRSLGVSVVANTQHPIAEHLGPFGSTIKSNFGARIVVGAIEPEGASALFGKSYGESIAEVLRSGIPGRMVYQGLAGADGGTWQLGQGLLTPRPILDGLVPAVTDGRPVQFDPVADVVDLDDHRNEGNAA